LNHCDGWEGIGHANVLLGEVRYAHIVRHARYALIVRHVLVEIVVEPLKQKDGYAFLDVLIIFRTTIMCLNFV
jgi:hypothetical protein